MAVAQGINKTLAYKVQSGLGTAASGSGGQLLRRVTGAFNVTNDTYENNEIASHQQSTGATHGINRSAASLSGLASCSTYAAFQAALLRKAWAATTAISSVTLTIAASGSNYTITRSAGSWFTDGLKVGDVVVLSGGSLAAGNLNKNCVVTDIASATVCTVNVPTGSSLTAEGPIASCTVTVTGKKTWVPTSSHTNLYYTFEEYYSDLTRSHVYQDVQVSQIALSVPATGNVQMNLDFVGLGSVSRTGTQVLTSPTAETSTTVFSSVNAYVYIDGVKQGAVSSVNLTITGNVAGGEAVVGSNNLPDVQRGRIAVTGTFTALYESDTLTTIRDDQTISEMIIVIADDSTDTADYVSIALPAVKVFSSDADDGEKQIVRTYNFTAQKTAAGGSGTEHNDTIIQLQDSTQ